ncbi:MAG: hypothetical protein KGK08_04965 [Acidobacteriota bacterium]|nr:hypothetical protein [Acidobacteriota bacterium]
MRQGNRVVRGLKVVVLVLLGAVVIGVVVRSLWNGLLPPLFGLPAITYWQALGLFTLSKLLFGGFHRHGGGGRWRERMMERWASMSEEERERFRTAMRERRGWCAPRPDTQA